MRSNLTSVTPIACYTTGKKEVASAPYLIQQLDSLTLTCMYVKLL